MRKLPKASGLRRGAAQLQTKLIRALGRTPLAPKNTVVLRYVGPKSGRAIELPVWAVHDPTRQRWVVGVGASDVKTWWRTFRTPTPLTLTDTAGQTHELIGTLATGEEKQYATATYFAKIPSSRTVFGADAPFLILTSR